MGGPMLSTTLRASDELAFYEGARRLDNLGYLDALGWAEQRQNLLTDINRKRSKARVFYTFMGAGVASSLAGAVGAEYSLTLSAYHQWQALTVAGVGAIAIGAIGGSIPAGRANRLQYAPESLGSVVELRQQVVERNEALRVQLGITEEQALAMESP